MERFLSLPSLPVIKRQTCPATLWNTNMNYIYRQTRNHPLTNSKILIPILKFFDNARIFQVKYVKYRLFLIQFAVMEIKHLRVLPRQDAFSRVSQPATAKSGFNRRIVSLIDQKFDDEPASYDRDA